MYAILVPTQATAPEVDIAGGDDGNIHETKSLSTLLRKRQQMGNDAPPARRSSLAAGQ